MHLQSCLHPVRVFNPSLNDYVCVPCRKCAACRMNQQLTLVNRLEYEAQMSKYVLFFTLTYDDSYVPYISVEWNGEVDGNGDKVYQFYSDTYMNADGSAFMLFESSDFEKTNWNNRDFKYLEMISQGKSLRMHDNKIRTFSRKHIQDFMKRLRRNIEYHYGIEASKIRYFICCEYGPQTYRPHYHGIIFTDSNQAFRMWKLIHKNWKFGRTDCQFSKGKCADYVAKYVACANSYPKIYEHPDLRPFTLYSRRPAIGTPRLGAQETKEIYSDEDYQLVIARASKVESVPLWRSFENSYFPRCKKFDELSHSYRVRLYQVASRLQGFLASGIQKEEALKIISHDYTGLPTSSTLFVEDSDISISRRFLSLCFHYNMSADYLCRKIEKYYDKKKLSLLNEQYKYQEHYVNTQSFPDPIGLPRSNHLSTLSAFYLNDLYKLRDLLKKDVVMRNKGYQFTTFFPPKYLYMLDSFGFPFTCDSDDEYVYQVQDIIDRFSEVSDVMAYRSQCKKILKDSMKTKYFNDSHNLI